MLKTASGLEKTKKVNVSQRMKDTKLDPWLESHIYTVPRIILVLEIVQVSTGVSPV